MERIGISPFLSASVDIGDGHRHFVSFSPKPPQITRVSVHQTEFELSPAVFLVDHVQSDAKPHGHTVQHEAGGPLMFANRLMEEGERVHD